MIGTIRKHSTGLWWIIIAAIIITFVWWGSQTSNMDAGRSRGSFGSLNGQKISANMFTDAYNEVRLLYFFSTGSFPGRGRTMPGFDPDRETWIRLLMIQKQADMGVHVSDEAVAKAASDRLRAINRGNPVPVDVFAKRVLEPEGLTLPDLERYLRHELGVQQLVSVLGVGGELLTPQEIRALYEREHQELLAQVAFFTASNYLSKVTVTPEAVQQFYTNRMASYRLPDRVQVNYVLFPLTNFLAEAKTELEAITNLTELIEARYAELGTNFISEAKSPEEAKAKIREMALNERALAAAAKKATEFNNELAQDTNATASTLAALAKAKDMTPLVTAPFDREEPPAGLPVRADFIKAAFNLTAEYPFCRPIAGEDGAYVISLHTNLPSEVPPLDSIRDRVTSDYRFIEAVMKARQAALDFQGVATNALAAGKKFEDVCKDAGTPATPLPAFSISTRNLPLVERHLPLANFKQAAFSTTPGKMSPALPSNDGAFALFVQAKLPFDETKVAADLPAFTRAVRQNRRTEAFNQWFQREAEKAFRTVPYFQQKSQLSSTPGMPKP
jgi:hypothetical protein